MDIANARQRTAPKMVWVIPPVDYSHGEEEDKVANDSGGARTFLSVLKAAYMHTVHSYDSKGSFE